MHKIDWDEILRIVAAVGCVAFFGALAAFGMGYLAILMVFDTFFGRW